MKRVIQGLAVLAVAFVIGRWTFMAMVSDETKIRWLVERMEQGYDDGDLSDCVGPLREDWHHEGYLLDRERLKLGLFQTFREERERGSGKRTSKVEVDEEAMQITVDGDKARLTADAAFSRLRGGEWEDTWNIRVEADLEKGDDGWKIARTRHEDLKGTPLSR